jgi:hypothetical protein
MPEKQLDVPLTPAGDAPVVRQIPKEPEETDPDAIEPEPKAAPAVKSVPGIPPGDEATLLERKLRTRRFLVPLSIEGRQIAGC